MVCRNLCTDYHAVGKYANGGKFCKGCDIYVEWEGKFCPCCNVILRRKPLSGKRRTYVRM